VEQQAPPFGTTVHRTGIYFIPKDLFEIPDLKIWAVGVSSTLAAGELWPKCAK
jgi:hypothetical protein